MQTKVQPGAQEKEECTESVVRRRGEEGYLLMLDISCTISPFYAISFFALK